MLRYALMIPMIALLTCCAKSPEPTANSNPPILRTYAVPEGMGPQVVRVLNRNMSAIAQKEAMDVTGRAELLPNGHVAFLAPESIHQGMNELLESLKNTPAPPAVNAQMELWFVLVNNEGQQKQVLGNQELRDVVHEALQGEPAFAKVLEKFRLQVSAGNKARIRGHYFAMEYMLSPKGKDLVARLEIEANRLNSELRTDLYLKADKYLILGESSVIVREDYLTRSGIKDGDYTLLIIMKADTGA